MNYQQQLANSAAIRAEIQRFESVHPNIYSIYELLERVEEPVLQNQIREHVIAIEGRRCSPACQGRWIVSVHLIMDNRVSPVRKWHCAAASWAARMSRSGPSRRLGAAAWDGATRSVTGYQAWPERLAWTLKMCFEKRCCCGCCSGQPAQLLHGCPFPQFLDTGEIFGPGACREPVGPRQHHVPGQVCLPSCKRWAF
ncbi:hypothetical protein NN561_012535 [Cricetulus griseus]